MVGLARITNCPYSFLNIVHPVTFACNKTTYHLYKKNPGLSGERVQWKRKGEVGCPWCLLEMLLPITGTRCWHSQFLTSVLRWPREHRAWGGQGRHRYSVWENALCYRQLESIGVVLPWGKPAFSFASVSHPALPPAWLFPSYDYTHDPEFFRQLRHV